MYQCTFEVLLAMPCCVLFALPNTPHGELVMPTLLPIRSKRLPRSIHNHLARPTHQHTQQPPTSTRPPGQQTRTELNLPYPTHPPLPTNILTSRQHPPAAPICPPSSPPRNLHHAPLAEENTPNPTIATDQHLPNQHQLTTPALPSPTSTIHQDTPAQHPPSTIHQHPLTATPHCRKTHTNPTQQRPPKHPPLPEPGKGVRHQGRGLKQHARLFVGAFFLAPGDLPDLRPPRFL